MEVEMVVEVVKAKEVVMVPMLQSVDLRVFVPEEREDLVEYLGVVRVVSMVVGTEAIGCTEGCILVHTQPATHTAR